MEYTLVVMDGTVVRWFVRSLGSFARLVRSSQHSTAHTAQDSTDARLSSLPTAPRRFRRTCWIMARPGQARPSLISFALDMDFLVSSMPHNEPFSVMPMYIIYIYISTWLLLLLLLPPPPPSGHLMTRPGNRPTVCRRTGHARFNDSHHVTSRHITSRHSYEKPRQRHR